MFRLMALVALIPMCVAALSSNDPYDDEPIVYMEAHSPKFAKQLRNKDFYRFTRDHGDDVAHLLRDDELDMEEFDPDFARPTRSQEKSDNFVRFGRGNTDFVRFGRDPYKYNDQNFLRFGRSVQDAAGKKRSKRDVGEEAQKRNDRDNFLRFGRGDDSFIRYGRDHGDKTVSNKPHGFGHGQSGCLLQDSLLLSILKKLEEIKLNN